MKAVVIGETHRAPDGGVVLVGWHWQLDPHESPDDPEVLAQIRVQAEMVLAMKADLEALDLGQLPS